MNELISKITHKASQLSKAEQRLIEDNSKHNIDNWRATRRALHQLALELEKATQENI